MWLLSHVVLAPIVWLARDPQLQENNGAIAIAADRVSIDARVAELVESLCSLVVINGRTGRCGPLYLEQPCEARS